MSSNCSCSCGNEYVPKPCPIVSSSYMPSVGIMLVPSDETLAISTETLQHVGSILQLLGASAATIAVTEALATMDLLVPTRIAGINSSTLPWFIKIPGTFQAQYISIPFGITDNRGGFCDQLFQTGHVSGGILHISDNLFQMGLTGDDLLCATAIILVPSDTMGFVSNDTTLAVSSILDSLHVDTVTITKANEALATMATLSLTMLSGIDLYAPIWFVKVTGSFDAQLLSVMPQQNIRVPFCLGCNVI